MVKAAAVVVVELRQPRQRQQRDDPSRVEWVPEKDWNDPKIHESTAREVVKTQGVNGVGDRLRGRECWVGPVVAVTRRLPRDSWCASGCLVVQFQAGRHTQDPVCACVCVLTFFAKRTTVTHTCHTAHPLTYRCCFLLHTHPSIHPSIHPSHCITPPTSHPSTSLPALHRQFCVSDSTYTHHLAERSLLLVLLSWTLYINKFRLTCLPTNQPQH